MRFLIAPLFFLCSFFSLAQSESRFPASEKETVVDTLHGQLVVDDFRYLEDLNDERTTQWIENQKKYFNKYYRNLVRSEDLKEQIRNLSRIRYYKFGDWDFEEDDDKYDFRIRSSRSDKTPDLYYKPVASADYSRLFKASDFKRSRDDKVLIRSYRVSPSEKYIAVAISHSGEDGKEILIFDLETKAQTDSLIPNSLQADIVWDDKGFYYDSFAEETRFSIKANSTLKYHAIGSAVDKTVFINPDTTGSRRFGYRSPEDDEMFIHYQQPIKSKWYDVFGYIDLSSGSDNFYIKNYLITPEISQFKVQPQFVKGDSIIAIADINSPNGKVVMLNKNKRNSLTNIVPETDQLLIDVNSMGKNHLACFYRQKAAYTVLIFNYAGELIKKLTFPQGSKVSDFFLNEDETEVYYSVSSYTHPELFYKMSLSNWSSSRLADMTIPYDNENLEVSYIEYPSSDGVMIPMHIIKRKDLDLNANLPTLIYAYGGYGVTIEPSFRREYVLWLMNGGVLAVPNIRGGGAEGSEWALAGRGVNKENTVNDFVSAAVFLIENGYTNSEKIAIKGGSHGGFLVGAAMTKRPDLFKAVVASAGVLDVVRFKRYTIGGTQNNLEEFGDPDLEEEFPFIYKLSPYHQLSENVTYPSTLLVTGDSDDRVPPLHSYKFLAKLQSVADDNSNFYIRINEGAGHSLSSSGLDYLETTASIYLFIMDQLKMDLRVW